MKVDGVPITINVRGTVLGTYTLNGKDLKMNLNNGKAKVDIDYEANGMDAKTKAAMDKRIRAEINGYKNNVKKNFDGTPNMNSLKIVSLESKRLIVIDHGERISFYAE